MHTSIRCVCVEKWEVADLMIVCMAKEPTWNLQPKTQTHNQFHLFTFKWNFLKCVFSDKWYEADRGHLLLYELVPVLLYKIPGKQITSEAFAHSADDQGQLLCLDNVPLQTFL